jgi:hypothetical protein
MIESVSSHIKKLGFDFIHKIRLAPVAFGTLKNNR